MKLITMIILAVGSCVPQIEPTIESKYETFSSSDLSDLEDSLKSRSSWSKAIRFNVYAAPTKLEALTDLAGNYTPEEVGTNLVFTPDKGFKGQGISNPDSYIDTKVVPMITGNPPIYTALSFDNVTYGVYIIDPPSSSVGVKYLFGAVDDSDRQWFAYIDQGKTYYTTCDDAIINESSGHIAEGLHVFKQDDNYSEYYKISGPSSFDDVDDPNLIENVSIYDLWANLDLNSDGVSGKSFDGYIAVSFVYEYLTDSEVDAIKDDIENYLTLIGAI